MAKDTPYIPPHFLRYKSQADCPQRVRDTIKSILQEKESTTARYKVKPEFITVVDSDRKFVEVSESFCRLLEYRREELIGKPYDDVTAPNTNDIPTVFRLCFRQLDLAPFDRLDVRSAISRPVTTNQMAIRSSSIRRVRGMAGMPLGVAWQRIFTNSAWMMSPFSAFCGTQM
jgi:PAS domain-containing protein